jgi:hypothetical protein
MNVKQLLLTSSLLLAISQESRAQYCAPNYFFGCGLGDRINHFVVNGDNSSVISTTNSGCGTNNYEDITGANVTFSTGSSYLVTINSGTVYDHVQVFIDFNNDQTFQTTETVGGMDSVAMQPATSNFNIAIPSGATLGGHRMRVVLNGDYMYPNISPCPDQTYGAGEVHDYTAIIQQGCDTPASLAATAVTFDGTTLTWAAVTGAQGYMYGVTTNSTPPTTGTYTTTLSGPVTGLISATPYWGWVRTVCGVGDSSAWVSVQFTTSLCPAPTGINATSVTSTSATIGWTAVSGAQGYQYAATTSSTAPATGTYTTNNSGPVTGLTALTGYYAWVRTVCGVGDTSAWASNQFTTTSSVFTIGYNNFSFEAYPNPVKNILTVAALGNRTGEATIQVTDFIGKLVKTYALDAQEMTIDMSSVAPGVYFIRYADGEHRQTVKVIKE